MATNNESRSNAQFGSDSKSSDQQAALQNTTMQQGDASSGGDGQLSEVLKQSGKVLADEVKKDSKRLVSDVTQQAREVAQEKQGAAGEFLKAIAEAASNSANLLDERGYTSGSRMVNLLAEELETFADEITDRSPKEILQEAADIARRHPGMALAGGLLVGFVLVRVLNAGDETANDDDSGDEDREAGDE